MSLAKIMSFFPEVKHPVEKKLSFNVKLKWTLAVLGAFFILANVPLFGLAANALSRFEYLAVILGTDFGSIISLGIGPIVMASIILQLLAGAGILKIDTSTKEGKKTYQGYQKIGVLIFIVFEALVYVLMGGLQPRPGLAGILIFQLMLGGLAILFMDEISSKWGFGSGVSLFILAGVSWRLFTGLFQFIGPAGENCLADFSNTACAGKILVIIQSVINGAPKELLSAVSAIVITALIFLAVVWAQSLKIEIPLSYDRLRGYQVKWPLQFFYASVMPVILVGALLANIQLFGGLIQNWVGHATFLGDFQNGFTNTGLVYWLSYSNVLDAIIRHSMTGRMILQALSYLIFYMALSALFAVFWVKTSGMDAKDQARKVVASGLQIPGFRKDERVLEAVFARYVMPLTIMGGLAIGALAAVSDALGALTSGTAILLAIMTAYQFYQNIAQQHAVDMHPAMRGLIK